MYKILFVRNPKAYLPEISAYVNYFNKSEHFQAYDSKDLKSDLDLAQFDVIWEFMGRGGTKIESNQLSVHEYVSLSTGRMPRIKNLVKSTLNPKPDLRVFLNPDVKNDFKFNDSVPFVYRDMGINPSFINKGKQPEKEYDFVYTGVIASVRGLDVFLKAFSENPNGKLLLIGEASEEIFGMYHNHPNITFTGVLPYNEVASYVSKAKYGINYIPNKYPFNKQTSTKLIEYLSLGLEIITTDYKWVRDFEKKYQLNFHYLTENNEINIEQIEADSTKNHFNAESFLWDEIIRESHLEEELLKLLKDK